MAGEQKTPSFVDGRWPNLFLVGAGRSGTTTMHAWLDLHPSIHMSPIKEPMYFVRDSLGPHVRSVVRSQGDYLQLFAGGHGHAYRGESTPLYFWSESAAREIRRTVPDARILVLLREPIARTYSSYGRAWASGVERRPFGRAIRDEAAGFGQTFYVRASRYATNLRRYVDVFPPHQVHVEFFEDLMSDARAGLDRIFRWLGLDSGPVVNAPLHGEKNRYRRPRGPVARWLLTTPWLPPPARRAVPEFARRAAHSMIFDARPPPPVEPADRVFLSTTLASEVLELEALLGRSTPDSWRAAMPGLPVARARVML